MAEQQNLNMSTRDHEKTFEGFTKIVTRTAIAIIVFLVLLAIFNG